MNNRKMTRGRKFKYVPAEKVVDTKFGPVTVQDSKRMVKQPVSVAEHRPIRNEGLVYDKRTNKWVKKEDKDDTKGKSRS